MLVCGKDGWTDGWTGSFVRFPSGWLVGWSARLMVRLLVYLLVSSECPLAKVRPFFPFVFGIWGLCDVEGDLMVYDGIALRHSAAIVWV